MPPMDEQPQVDTYTQVMAASGFEVQLKNVAQAIRDSGLVAINEASLAGKFEIELYSLMKNNFKLDFVPTKELKVATARLVSKGRIDSSYGAFIVEFKQHSKFKTPAQQAKAEEQLGDYLMGLWKDDNANRLGFVTDGVRGAFIRIEDGTLQKEGIGDLSAATMRRIVRTLLTLDQIALTPANLVRDFCLPLSDSLYRRVARSFFAKLNGKPSEKTQMLFGEWRELFRLAHDDSTQQLVLQKRRQVLAETLQVEIAGNDDEYRALYALQSTYALIVKLIAYKVVSDLHFGRPIIRFADLAELHQSELRKVLAEMEEGATFRQAGILNLLEGDFFSWYAEISEWTPDVALLVTEIVTMLAKYENKVLTQDYTATRDLFRDLYQQVIPSTVRHSLGEYYTPPWLADELIERAMTDQLSGRPGWTALDPCAGAGTFITKLIERVLLETEGMEKSARLEAILTRVVAIDLNPLAVLTTRVNYFVNVAPVTDPAVQMHIPVYLGDASYVPTPTKVAGVLCYAYEITTLKGPLRIVVPRSALKSASKFSVTMTEVEGDTKLLQEAKITGRLEALCDAEDLVPEVRTVLKDLAFQLVELERKGWNGIWARIVTNFLSTASLGRFDLIVGNPPWIDWKNLPAGYRERIKSICVDRHLFSGDRITGGINLNICALIANVAADNWLKDDGVLAFLMPENMLFQQTYEGFRNFELDGQGRRLYLQEVLDFTASGHPFKPVQYKFHGYLYGAAKVDYLTGVPVRSYVKRRGTPSIETLNALVSFDQVRAHFDDSRRLVGTLHSGVTAFTYAPSALVLAKYRDVAGPCSYIGREGIEFYPQELFLLVPQYDVPAPEGCLYLSNFQNTGKSKYAIAKQQILLETKFLYPLVKGIDIDRYRVISDTPFLAPFPYDETDMRLPIPWDQLTEDAPKLAKYLRKHQDVLDAQTDYNKRIIGKKSQEFHALARVGAYSFQDVHVAFRDNTKWCTTVTTPMNMPWGERRRPLFQNHAPTICERVGGGYITKLEAHFISGILNTNVVSDFIASSSDSRTFKIRPPVYVPLFDETNLVMKRLADAARELSATIAAGKADPAKEREIEALYLELARARRL